MSICRGVTLPGADIGLTYFFQPVWEKMLEAEVWVYAAAQVKYREIIQVVPWVLMTANQTQLLS